jgi:hypothetical protein
VFIRRSFGKSYAENSRETVRRQVLHQLVQARVVDLNPDDPSLPTNSPRSHYGLTPNALRVLRAYETPTFEVECRKFLERHGALEDAYRKKRTKRMISLTLPAGGVVGLSPGKHNRLEVAVITEFRAHFAPDAEILYLGDTANKTLVLEAASLEKLGVLVTKHDKLPDIVLYSRPKRRLYLIEAVTSHGPVSPKRFAELEAVMSRCEEKRVYVSAFLDFKEFRRQIRNIAWETEVWVAEVPDHMIHFNGEDFLE